MLSRAERIAELEHAAAEAMEEASRSFARARALREEARLLREGAEVATHLAAMSRVDAIVAVLRQAGAPMSPTEIGRALVAGGRPEDSRQTITATLSYLAQSGRVMKVARGQYATAA